MADDKKKRGAADRSRVAGGEAYEVTYFARKHGISQAQAKDIIKRFGPSRARCDTAAKKLKA
jgi:hypothetical protein